MGRKSKRRQGIQMDELDDVMMDLNRPDRVDAKQKARDAKRQKRLMKKLAKQQRQMLHHTGTSNKNRSEKHNRWHKITVKSEAVLEKNFIFSSFASSVEVEFQPLGYHKIDGQACFYLEANTSAAPAILGLNNRVQGPDGSCLKISVEKCVAPELILNSNQLQVLREVMASRYNAATCLLDLTNLHHDPALLAKDILVPLASPHVMKQVLRQIRECVPQLKALNLSNNDLRVSNLKLLQSLQTDLTNLSALNLEHNKIGDMQVLKLIKIFPLTELSLQFNPIVERYKVNPLKYVIAVKKELKSLKLLDKVDVDAYLAENVKQKTENLSVIKDSTSSSSNPGCSSVTSEVSESMVRTFLEQYFSLVDTPQRPHLLAAYTPDAVMEIKSNVSAIASTVFVGHQKIGEALLSLPATLHNHSTFGLNVYHPSANNAQAVVTGECQIAGVDNAFTFCRSMNIVPFNSGLCCSQDVLELR